MTRRWRAPELCALATLLALAAGCTREPNTLTCPAGTRHGKSYVRDWQMEFCVDTHSGLREGPERQWSSEKRLVTELVNRGGKPNGIARTYGSDGSLYSEDTFDHGELRATRFTLAGLKQQIEQMNANFRAEKSALGEFQVVDERTLAYVVHVDRATANLMATASEELSNKSWNSDAMKALRRGSFCRMFTFGIETVIYRYVDENDHVVATRSVTSADCT
jgi:hypothetical protein